MAENNGEEPPDSNVNTTASSDYNTAPSDEEQITLFAPFEANKGYSKKFQKSSDADSDASGKEIEFQSSQSQSTGNAKVFFRKLKAAMSSGTSSASYSSTTTPSPAQQSIAKGNNGNFSGRPNTLKVNIIPPEDKSGKERSKYEGQSSTSAGRNVGSSSGQVVSREVSGRVHTNIISSEDPRISLTSYSDVTHRVGREDGIGGESRHDGGSGAAAGGSGGVAVNKSEMLKRFGTIANSKVQDTNTDLKKYWMPDKACKECSNCSVKFGVFIRRHHCRICGRIFCHSCCSMTIPGEALRSGLQGNMRTCRDCFEVFNEFRRSRGSDKAAQLQSDSVPIDHIPSSSYPSKMGGESPQPLHGSGNFGRTLSGPRPTMSILSPHKSWDEGSSVGGGGGVGGGGAGGRSQEHLDMSPSRTVAIEFDNPTPTRRRLSNRRPTDFDGIGVKRQRQSVIILDEDEVGCIASAIWSKFLEPSTGLARSSHRYRLRTFSDSYSAMSIVTWLLSNGYVASRQASVQVGQALVDTKRLKIVSSADSEFRDEINQFLELGEAANLPVEEGKGPIVRDAPKWFQHLPQESDSEYDAGSRSSLHETYPAAVGARVRLGPTPSSGGMYDHSVTLSSISKLTGSRESMSDVRKPSDDDYLVLDEDLMSKSHESSMPSSRQTSPFPETSPSTHRDTPGEPENSSSPITKFEIGNSPLKSQDGVSDKYEDPLPDSRGTLASPGSKSLAIVTMQNGTPQIADQATINAEAADSEEWYRSKTVEEADLVLQKMYNSHFDSLMTQIIKSYGLSLSWLHILRPLIVEATQTVRTDVYAEDLMDINEYVRVKKIPCGEKIDSTFTYGVVCSKNVTHKKMKSQITKPTILLIKCSLSFSRHENDFAVFDTLKSQELAFLKHLVDRVRVINPSIILVQKSVSRIALEDLFNLGVVVAVNVKPRVMRRVARCTGAEIMTSLTQLSYNVRLGTCGKFYLRNFTLESGIKKTLMYFDHCEPQLGCVITLQGGTNRELKKVKKVTQFGLHLAHNSILESSFLLDEFAWPEKSADSDEEVPVEPYESCDTTPEIPLYPSLAHPLESLPPAEIIRRLEFHGLCGPMEKEIEESETEQKDEEEGIVEDKQHSVEGTEVPSDQQQTVANSEVNKEPHKVVSSPSKLASNVGKSESTAPKSSDQSLEGQPSKEPADSQPSNLYSRDSEVTIEPTDHVSTGSREVALFEIGSKATLEDPNIRLQSVDSEILANLAEIEFRAALGRQLISISPRVKYNVPYLQTAAGRHADIRKYLSRVIYWSVQFASKPRKILNVRVSLDGDNLSLTAEDNVNKEGNTVSTGQEVSLVKTKSQLSTQTHHLPSYKSVAEHPLTNSFLLLRANTNEMQAALADFRARAGQENEENTFFFKAAKQATDYRLLLQNVFNKYKQFEIELEEEEEEVDDGPGKKKRWKKKRKQKRKWWKRKLKERENERVEVDGDGNNNVKLQKELRDSSSDDSDSEGDDRDGMDALEPAGLNNSGGGVSGVGGAKCEEDGNIQARMVSRSREHTPATYSKGQEVGAVFGQLEDMNQKQPSQKKSAKDVGSNMPSYGLDMDYSETWMAIDQYTDCLDPIKHQGISILFSNTCHEGQKQQRPCLSPCIIPMFYYGQNDIAVGDFLQRYCFKDFYKCPICSIDMAKHIRHIIHGSRSIHIEIRATGSGSPTKDENIYTWLECLKCHHSTPYTVMSVNSLIFSFAKFLELKFYSDSYVTRSHGDDMRCSCSHRLHPDYSQYFRYKNKLAIFRPSTIDILEVLLPPTEVVITTPSNKYLLDYASDIKHIGRIVEGVFCRIRQKLEKYRLEPVSGLINDHISVTRGERDAMRTKVKHLKELMVQEGFVETKIKFGAAPSGPGIPLKEEIMTSIQDCLEDLKRAITEVVECWNILLEKLDDRARDYRRKLREGGGGEMALPVTLPVDTSNKSPRESPVAIITATPQTHSNNFTVPSSAVVVAGSSPSSSSGTTSNAATPLAPSILNGSPSLPGKKHSTPDGFGLTILMSNRLRHERNLSDGGGARGDGNVGGASSGGSGAAGGKGTGSSSASDKQHCRNLSDTPANKDILGVFPEGDYTALSPASSGHVLSTETLQTPDSVSPAHKMDAGTVSPAHGEESEVLEVGEEPGTEADGVDVIRYRDLEQKEELAVEEVSTMQQSPTEKDDRVGGAIDGDHTYSDTSMGFLAKFRANPDWRDDPTKYYLLDPSLISAVGSSSPSNTSGVSSGSGSSRVPPASGGEGLAGAGAGAGNGGAGTNGVGVAGRAPSSRKSRKSGPGISASTAEGDSGKAERIRGRDKDRLSVLSRPFQRLPPPLEYSEHHTMPSHTDFPIAIYEKEPTSIIAYALSTRHYTNELKLLRDRKAMGGAGMVSVASASNLSPKFKRYLSSEADRQMTVNSSSAAINGGQYGGLGAPNPSKFFKKKGSNISLFTTSNHHGADFTDPFEQSADVSFRKIDMTSSSSGHSTRSGDLGSEVVSSSATSGSGVPPTGGTVASGGTDELDQGGKARGHISLEFSNSDKTANFFCKVYFAEEFRQLRDRIFPAGEDKFIRSLTRCVKFEAKGGKSRSAFCKVADDRFILKQVKSIEISAFEDFAPRYLDYINKALEEKRPLALAKIVGAYSIGFKNSKTGNSKRMDVIIMENLLYEHSVARVFDLKGSMRSRYVDPSKDSSSDVLLDENYLNTICHAPVYVHPHSKFVLMQALMADSEFLARNSIMDYSLLTCIDDNTGTLVVGIIDYVRTFTFDKRLEMYLKKTSGRELPTVVYPELYRKRFCEAMERYFTVVPDKWSGLGMDF